MNRSFLFLLLITLFFQANCLYNPIVREVLELDGQGKKDEYLKYLPFFLGPSSIGARMTPTLGNLIRTDSQIHVVFNRSMDPESFSAILGSSLTTVWSDTFQSNDTVTLTGNHPLGIITFTMDAKDSNGNQMQTITGNYTVVSTNTNLYYVSVFGNDGNLGTTPTNPKQSILSAISGSVSPAAILVSAGEYPLTASLSLMEGISLYGGFSQDFLNRDLSASTTRIFDSRTGSDLIAIVAGPAVSVATYFDGFTVQSANDPATIQSTAFFCNGGSPIISRNRMLGGTASTGSGYSIGIRISGASPNIIDNYNIQAGDALDTFGIFIENSSSPTITNNTISGGSAAGSDHALYSGPQNNNPIISNNVISGKTGSISYGLNSSFPSNVTLTNNFINGGSGNLSIAIYNGAGNGTSRGNYSSNRLFTSGGTNRFCMYEAGITAPTYNSPISFNNNQLFDCPSGLYFDNNTPIFDFNTINGLTIGGALYTGNF
ncbi:Hypothetical protein LBF_2733 [Leptospira biflexa serovar Patoc strain 'Patoc 1 (Ames)']|uniref:DUF1565 domain-containing protein n=1 Tax=Leptospira biflexa serovar Patoc (strain Patoc 1 / ATCC 23582 / Paris) TaxID=456481 RepID=B0SND3_LEPBP|nr:right-handed parallel beta-helix repeat-containing protein [Leptospira biflexa]ABZ95214.1 Hypothetical protein LBF_2733 [Leptospira biflexa serovar Patoc strain 'Patoc 1 (Ames)']ABZ98900.1 Hypothetical protein LEPBI_I2825 [Leptospira biflexa serovar Patoc strain 'Patoc 1 (Paris)']